MVEIKEFLNPKSMMTPGIAGGLTVSISLPIAFEFNVSFKWIALIVSLLFSLVTVLQFADVKTNILKGTYIILNTLIIFSVSVGAGINIDRPPMFPMQSNSHRFDSNKNTPLFSSLFSMSAYAQSNPTIESDQNEDITSDPKEKPDEREIQKLEDDLQREKERLKQEEALIQKQKEEIEKYRIMREKYDKRWSW